MKTFDLEAFKAGQNALTRDGRIATFIGVCEECSELHYLIIHIEGEKHTSAIRESGTLFETAISVVDLVSMVSRHQALIDAYDPEDTWQVHAKQSGTWVTIKEPTWDEDYEWRLHPHNDLIKAWKKGAKIEIMEKDGTWVDIESPYWYEDAEYRIKPEPEFMYPIYKKHIDDTGLIVKFLSMTEGEIVENGKTGYIVGQLHNDWWVHTDASVWQDWTPITKSKPTIHCLAYDAKRFDHEQTTAVRARVVKKEVAQANGWTIIKEWEV